MKINIKKTEMVHQPPLKHHDKGKEIHIDDQKLAKVSEFKYLGSTVTNNNMMDEEINTRMSNAPISHDRLK